MSERNESIEESCVAEWLTWRDEAEEGRLEWERTQVFFGAYAVYLSILTANHSLTTGEVSWGMALVSAVMVALLALGRWSMSKADGIRRGFHEEVFWRRVDFIATHAAVRERHRFAHALLERIEERFSETKEEE